MHRHRTYEDVNECSVGNLAHAHFCSRFFSIPLKDNKDPSPDAYTPRELSDSLSLLFGYVFLDLEPTDSLRNRMAAAAEAQRMGTIMAKSVSNARGSVVRRFMQALGRSEATPGSYGQELVNRLLREGKSVDEVVWTIIPTAAAACATQAQGVSLHQQDKLWHTDNAVGTNARPLFIGQVRLALARYTKARTLH
jgi:hypothetical protein